jgi:hypothetical protein
MKERKNEWINEREKDGKFSLYRWSGEMLKVLHLLNDKHFHTVQGKIRMENPYTIQRNEGTKMAVATYWFLY